MDSASESLIPANTYDFLAGGGEMGMLIRSHDWSQSSLGLVENWPQSLRTTLSFLLSSKLPMFLWWGTDFIQFYNDSYSPSLINKGKHPITLGQKGGDFSPETWPVIRPLLDLVLAGGEAYWKQDQLIPIHRNGRTENVYWTLNYSSVRDENGRIAGVLVICNETTEKVINAERLNFAIEATELGTWEYNPLTGRFSGNERLREWFGLDVEKKEMDLMLAIDIMAEKDRPRVTAAIQRALEYDSGGLYDIEYSLIHPATQTERIVRAKGRAWFNEDKIAYRFNGTLQDITRDTIVQKQVRESELLALNIIQHSETAQIVWLGEAMVVTMVNEKMLEILDKDSGIIGRPFMKVFPELMATPMMERIREVLLTGKTYYQFEELFVLNRNGQPYNGYFNYSYKALQNDSGENYGIICTATEVTQQVLSKQRVEESEQNLRSIILQAPVAMCIFRGSDHIMEIANDRMFELWGKGPESIIGKPIFEGLPESAGQGLEALIDRVYETGETFKALDVPVTLTRKHGKQTVYVDFVYEAFREADGPISGVMAIAIDVTEKVVAKKKVELEKERARLAIAAGELGVFEVDIETNEIVVDKRFNEIYGFDQSVTREEYIATCHPDDIQTRSNALEQGLKNGVFDYETRFFHKSGAIGWLKTKGHVLYDERNIPIKLFGVVQDITEQKTFSESLAKQVQERTMELNRSNEDLLQFAHVASHDLKEPVRKIKTFAMRIQDEYSDLLPEKGRIYLEKVHNATDRMFSMIEGVLNYSALSAAGQTNELVDLHRVIEMIEVDLEILIHQKRGAIIRDQLPVIEGAAVLIYQLFYNLINNSLKFSKPDTPPVISLLSSIITVNREEMAQIVFTDNGIGLDPAYADTIFNAFTRLNSKDRYEGTGLGLALCKKIVERHHGKITATGSAGESAVFTVILPLKQERKII